MKNPLQKPGLLFIISLLLLTASACDSSTNDKDEPMAKCIIKDTPVDDGQGFARFKDVPLLIFDLTMTLDVHALNDSNDLT